MKCLASCTGLAAVITVTLAAAPAQAIEVYAAVPGTVNLSPPVVYVPPVTYAPGVTSVQVNAMVSTTVDNPGGPTASALHPDPATAFFAGGGYGGMTAFHGGAASTYRLHVGLGLGPTELGLRADIASRALDALGNAPGGVWMLSAEVAHRFLPGATVRPVLAASFDRWEVSPDGRDSASAFGLGVRGGVEVHYPLSPSAALVFGADVALHHLLASVDNAAMASDVMTFGATVDIRL